MTLPPLDSPQWDGSLKAFAFGLRATSATILSVVLFVT
ncbi:MAG: branched-chain amino acid ABC transporter permease, partial [Bradyrhizobium sp.]|nr:branched-chain amino acid ABC transporter permease [Bradyrhizobium sp.]